MAIDSSGASKHYLKMKIESASSVGLVVILYDGGIKFLRKAVNEYKEKRYMGFVDHVIKAQNVIRELRDSLDMSVEEIAPQLRSLYTYMLKRLVNATVEKVTPPAEEVLSMLESLRATWDKVRAMAESGQVELPKSNNVLVRQELSKNSNRPTAPSISIRG
ncbi:flagellar export chaperone FliS [bacterium]|nr:flagellar export chaperone FliS [bacterium]